MGHNKIHSTEHTDGTDDIQDATSGVKGLATPAQIAKLNGIASQAGVPVLGIDNDPPVSPTTGDRYIVGVGTGAWAGQDDNIAEWDGDAWTFAVPDNGTLLPVGTGEGYVAQYFAGPSVGEGRSIGWQSWLDQQVGLGDTPTFSGVNLPFATTKKKERAIRFEDLRQHTYQDSVIDAQVAPPVTPTEGDRYIVLDEGPTGDWVGQESKIAIYVAGEGLLAPHWEFYTPNDGWTVYIDTLNEFYTWSTGSGLWNKANTEHTPSSVPDVTYATRLQDLYNGVYGHLIVNSTLTAPPIATAFAKYIVASVATGDWAGQEGKIAIYRPAYSPQNTQLGGAVAGPNPAAWVFITPTEGLQAYDQTSNTELRYNGSAWVSTTQNTYQELHVVTAGEVTAGSFTLTNNPATALGVRVEALDGVAQLHKQTLGIGAEVPDFDVLNTNEVHINNNGAATGLSGSIIEADKLLITYTGA